MPRPSTLELSIIPQPFLFITHGTPIKFYNPRSFYYLLQEEMFVGLHAHSMLVFAADLVEEPVQRIIVTFSVLHQTVPQNVHLLQTQS